MEDLILILMVMAAAGAVAGFLAGMLGIGGGIVMVPALYFAFGALSAPEAWHMHLTVATSLGIIVPTAFFSARAHHKRGAILVDKVIRPWAPWMVVSSILGTALAVNLKSTELVLFFAVIAGLMGIKLVLPLEGKILSEKPPKKPVSVLLAAFIGSASSLMGIGGATLSVPTLTLFNVPIHKAVGTASLLGLFIAFPATIGYIWQGIGVEGLPPYSFGFVNLVGVGVVAPVSSFMAPLGVRLAHRMPKRALSVAFGLFLIAAALRMSYPVLAS